MMCCISKDQHGFQLVGVFEIGLTVRDGRRPFTEDLSYLDSPFYISTTKEILNPEDSLPTPEKTSIKAIDLVLRDARFFDHIRKGERCEVSLFLPTPNRSVIFTSHPHMCAMLVLSVVVQNTRELFGENPTTFEKVCRYICR